MKKTIALFSFGVFALPLLSMAASGLASAGLGTVASDPTIFGVAVCNNGANDLTQSVPLSVTVDGTAESASSVASIPAGECAYTYFSYATFGMSAGKDYSVSVSIDGGSPVVYTATVPASSGEVLGANTQGENSSFAQGQLAAIGQLLASFVQQLQNLLHGF